MWATVERTVLTPRDADAIQSIHERTDWAGGLTAASPALVGAALQASDGTPFDGSVVRPEARNPVTLAVDSDRSRLVEARSGLSHTMSLTQLSQPFDSHELLIAPAADESSIDANHDGYV